MVTFDSKVLNVYTAENTDEYRLNQLYEKVREEQIGGGTDIYTAAKYAVNLINENYNPSDYTAAVILMTDGASAVENREKFEDFYIERGGDIPIFSIMFGSAESDQLDDIAQLTNARVFDGRKDLVGAFRSVKGYNLREKL